MHVKLLSSEAFFQAQMQQISYSGCAPPGPTGGAYSAPQTLAGPTFKERVGYREGEETGVENLPRLNFPFGYATGSSTE